MHSCNTSYFLQLNLQNVNMSILTHLSLTLHHFYNFISFVLQFADGELYSGTVADFSAVDALIIKKRLRTEQYDLKHLNGKHLNHKCHLHRNVEMLTFHYKNSFILYLL